MFHPQLPQHPHPQERPPPPQYSTKNFKINYGLTLLYALISLVLIIVWSVEYQSGFGIGNVFRKWNLHHLFMLLGMLIINGNAIIVFRVGKNCSKTVVTALHILFSVIGFAFAVAGIHMAYSFRSTYFRGNHMYSLHSWIGLLAVIFYAMQFIGGFLAHFPNPIVSTDYRKRMASAHKKIGMFVFAASSSAVLTGLLLRVALTVPYYMNINAESVIINFIAFFVLFFTMSLLYLVGYPKYRRIN